jgi:tetratricopeptide (TPR) repeat protein
MASAGRKTLWYALRAPSDEAQRARRRLAVGSALALLLAGLLAAARLEIVVLASAVLVVLLVGSRAAVIALRRNWMPLRTTAREVRAAVWRRGVLAATSMRALPGHLRLAAERLRPHVRHVVTLSVVCAASVRSTLTRELAHVRGSFQHARTGLQARRHDPQRDALRLNAAGTRHRRNGASAKAIELHGRALALLLDVDDPRAVALTQNNLALALSSIGEHDRATMLLEEAAATVHDLGDQECEGRIMANLALTHRRHGRRDECADALQLALTKLGPDTNEYKLVEAELSRVT